jgi:nucleotide-binding universal stress UspA family protein
MYRNVLVGVDEQDGSVDAAALARALAPHCERMSLINVRNKYYPGMRGVATDEYAAEKDHSIDLLRTLRDRLALDGELLSDAATSVGSGIRDAAEKIDADLIVVGSCRRSLIGRVVSGNDAISTLHQAPCAVAIAPRGYATADGAVKTIGVAYDGSPQSTVALIAARRLAQDVTATVKALDVEQITVHGYGWVSAYAESEQILLSNARDRLGTVAGVDLKVVVGLPGDELVRFSDDVDVLVCGSRERGPLKRVMLGSTSDFLVRHARSPLIIAPAGARSTRPGLPVQLQSCLPQAAR